MKNSLVIAAAALLGAADAGIHRMKLQKVPLEEQLVRLDMKLRPQRSNY